MLSVPWLYSRSLHRYSLSAALSGEKPVFLELPSRPEITQREMVSSSFLFSSWGGCGGHCPRLDCHLYASASSSCISSLSLSAAQTCDSQGLRDLFAYRPSLQACLTGLYFVPSLPPKLCSFLLCLSQWQQLQPPRGLPHLT